jgi:hypothetical protein
MNSFRRKQILVLSAVFVFWGASVSARAQDTSNTTVRHGPSEYDTSVRNAEVVYIAGNDLVLKLDDGRVEHMVVPDSDKFHVDGREVSVHDLKAGTKLTETIITTTIPRMVTTVRTIEGKVWHVNPPSSVVLSLPDGTNKRYKIPTDQKFTINGQEKTAFDLKKGMNISATVITDSPETVMSRSKKVTGQAPPPTPLPLVGVLLFSVSQTAAESAEPVTSVSTEHPSERLPKTATMLPLFALLGMSLLFLSLGIKVLRHS